MWVCDFEGLLFLAAATNEFNTLIGALLPSIDLDPTIQHVVNSTEHVYNTTKNVDNNTNTMCGLDLVYKAQAMQYVDIIR